MFAALVCSVGVHRQIMPYHSHVARRWASDRQVASGDAEGIDAKGAAAR
jgi:hypothetical protein